MTLAPHEAAELATELLDQGLAVAGEQSSVNFRWAGSSLTTNGATSSTSLSVVAISPAGGVATVATAGELTREVVTELVDRATAASAKASPAEEQSELITPEQTLPSPMQWDGAGPELDLAGVAGFTSGLGALFASVAEKTYALYGFADQHVHATWLASTTGLRLRHDQPSGSVACTGRGRDGQTSTWAGRQSMQLSDVDVAGLGEELARKLRWAQTKLDATTGRQEVILSPSAVADLIIAAHWDMSGRDAREGRSAYSNGASTKLNDRLAPRGVSLISDPHHPLMPNGPFHVATTNSSSQSVFDTGLPVQRTSWITDGVLTHLIETRSGQGGFAPIIGNLVLDGGSDKSLEDVIAGTERALYINTLWYIRQVDPSSMLLTGLTRDGVYVVRDGEIVGEAGNFRWNESPLGVLDRIVDSSRPELCLPREWGDWWEQAMMSALRVDGFNLSSPSAAI